MSIVGSISNALWQAGIDPGHNSGSGLRRGWDYWLPAASSGATSIGVDLDIATAKPDTDGNGMARLPHAHLMRGDGLPADGLPVLDLTMDTAALRAGIWRQCLIRPADDSVTEGRVAAPTSPVSVVARASDAVSALAAVTRANVPTSAVSSATRTHHRLLADVMHVQT